MPEAWTTLVIGDKNLCQEIPLPSGLDGWEHAQLRRLVKSFLIQDSYAYPLHLVWSQSTTENEVEIECVTDNWRIVRHRFGVIRETDSLLYPHELIANQFMEFIKHEHNQQES